MLVFLIGFMGSGKSFWGERLAQNLDFAFIDSDKEIERIQGKSIAQIFEIKGEDAFRLMERDWLDNFNGENTIVSTGGGMPVFYNNMQRFNEKGITIWIEEPFDKMYDRIQSDTNRPLLAKTKAELEELYKMRQPFYNQAKHHIKTPLIVSEFQSFLN